MVGGLFWSGRRHGTERRLAEQAPRPIPCIDGGAVFSLPSRYTVGGKLNASERGITSVGRKAVAEKRLTGRIAAERIRMMAVPRPPQGSVERFKALGDLTGV